MNLPTHLMPIVASKNKLEIVEVSESTKRFQTTIRDNFHMAVSGLEWCNHLYLDEAACKRLLDDLSTVGPLDLKQHADQMATATLEKTQLNNPQLAAWIAEKSASPVFANTSSGENYTLADLSTAQLELLTSNISRLDTRKLTWRERAGGWFVFAANKFNRGAGASRSYAFINLVAIGTESDEKAAYVLPLVAQVDGMRDEVSAELIAKHLKLLPANATTESTEYALAFNSFLLLGSYRSFEFPLGRYGFRRDFEFTGKREHFDQLVNFCNVALAAPAKYHRDAIYRFLRVMASIDSAQATQLAQDWKQDFPEQVGPLDRFLQEATRSQTALSN